MHFGNLERHTHVYVTWSPNIFPTSGVVRSTGCKQVGKDLLLVGDTSQALQRSQVASAPPTHNYTKIIGKVSSRSVAEVQITMSFSTLVSD